QAHPHQVSLPSPVRAAGDHLLSPGPPATGPTPDASTPNVFPSTSPSMRPNLLSLALCLALPGTALAAGPSPAPQSLPAAAAATSAEATEFDRVVVTATRTERAISDVPN